MSASLIDLDASQLRERLASGVVSAVDVAEAHLAQIEEREPDVQAFAWHDPAYVRAQAAELDRYRGTGRPLGPLHGLPVAIKDVIDTAKIPTENGTSLDAGRVPKLDAFVIQRLKQAGAIILGKTVTAELAFMHPGKTRNPHNLAHTPGGSSSGSAAAVAAGMAPLAIGTQTGGSVTRPAAFCGVTGFKPTFGAIPRTGVLSQSPTLDTVGVFARTPNDAALISDALFGYDPADKATSPAPAPNLLETASAAPPVKPIFAFIKPPQWDRATPETHAAMEELAGALGEQCFEIPLPPHFEDAAELRARINMAEMARNYHRYMRDGGEGLGAPTLKGVRTGAEILAKDYLAALDWRDVLYAGVEKVLEHADAILTPAALGPALEGLEYTGDSIFNGLWTFCGTPAVSLPLFTAENGLPMGAQLVGARGDDGRLLRTANWLFNWLDEV